MNLADTAHRQFASRQTREVCIRLAGRIRLRRLRQGISQAELARRCRLGRGTIKHLEWRPWSVSLETFVRACAALQVLHGRGAVFQWLTLQPPGRVAKLVDPRDVFTPGLVRAGRRNPVCRMRAAQAISRRSSCSS